MDPFSSLNDTRRSDKKPKDEKPDYNNLLPVIKQEPDSYCGADIAEDEAEILQIKIEKEESDSEYDGETLEIVSRKVKLENDWSVCNEYQIMAQTDQETLQGIIKEEDYEGTMAAVADGKDEEHWQLHTLRSQSSASDSSETLVRDRELLSPSRSDSEAESGPVCTSLANVTKSHKRNPTDKEPLICPSCGKNFRNQQKLKIHLAIHNGERPFTCTDCGKGFAAKRLLRIHLQVHTGERPFSCKECGKTFARRSHLYTHRKVHTGEKPYICTECGKSFARKIHLNNHHKVHTGEKPFTCIECGKSFSQKTNLSKHHKVHTGEKPFTCPDCGKSFSSKSNLHVHQTIHIRRYLPFVPDMGHGSV
ncbi:gastrula zinc finger protein XlCGF26.1-like isoform X2 [Xenopus laevis]|nr:gastrula zinc finger protein XlCGF26.1-like isoform X2 [Xenopus laevis]XP_018095566.1 gastrula zinc finger protein XlCGF26.1-like isoform X2 [Xenopus laevis]